ncbi:AMP-binding protein [Chitinasiproducens palmae]|uniref:Acetyl-CoA synthetase n=1 Tax=Chitinasiproducens palmae TaxID=1770053 RepID=A0A1H2PQN1_9BURK|nr:AMP-binding protein [Chitinasiproducens palmae]SDV49102.1 acetyl-CoA synthetase [Chitinasiproducens palmae]
MTTNAFLAARDFLLAHREEYARAYEGFRWPILDRFNWARDYFDVVAQGNQQEALRIVEEDGRVIRRSYAELSHISNQVANRLRGLGLVPGDRLLMMLPNHPALWELMLGAMKAGIVLVPTTTQFSGYELAERIEAAGVRGVVTLAEARERVDEALAARADDAPSRLLRIAVTDAPAEPGAAAPADGWLRYEDCLHQSAVFDDPPVTHADAPMLLYFTSGTTSRPKLVMHTHRSYPVGHLSTMYWIGLKPGDVHWNISSPGWAKHAWSCVFAPLNAQATVFIRNAARFDAGDTLRTLVEQRVTTLCAPPTVWRMLIQHDLASYAVTLREIVGAGEPLNPEIIEQVRRAWGITIRDGYGQTETTCQIGNTPGQAVVPGSMGRPLPGYAVDLVGPDGSVVDGPGDGELALSYQDRPAGLMAGYANAPMPAGTHYLTSDLAERRADGSFVYIGRADDVFKASDYRISPFELESILIEAPGVAEAAVVPSPDPTRLSVPKAFVVLRAGHAPDGETAARIFAYCRERLAPYQRIRRIEFAELPKTISGKIRRVALRAEEKARRASGQRGPHEFWEEELRADA